MTRFSTWATRAALAASIAATGPAPFRQAAFSFAGKAYAAGPAHAQNLETPDLVPDLVVADIHVKNRIPYLLRCRTDESAGAVTVGDSVIGFTMRDGQRVMITVDHMSSSPQRRETAEADITKKDKASLDRIQHFCFRQILDEVLVKLVWKGDAPPAMDKIAWTLFLRDPAPGKLGSPLFDGTPARPQEPLRSSGSLPAAER